MLASGCAWVRVAPVPPYGRICYVAPRTRRVAGPPAERGWQALHEWGDVMRPRKWFAVFRDGHIDRLIEGRTEAEALVRRLKASEHVAALRPFRSRLAAEEFAAWWGYRLDQRQSAQR